MSVKASAIPTVNEEMAIFSDGMSLITFVTAFLYDFFIELLNLFVFFDDKGLFALSSSLIVSSSFPSLLLDWFDSDKAVDVQKGVCCGFIEELLLLLLGATKVREVNGWFINASHVVRENPIQTTSSEVLVIFETAVC